MTPRPVFLHAGWRTGGTALGFALADSPNTLLFHDPFNLAVAGPWGAICDVTPTETSGHPRRESSYFASYAPLVVGDRISGAEERFFDAYRMDAADKDHEQSAFLASLLELARSSSCRAALKFEQSDGRTGWLRASFPNAAHVGLSRGADGQLASWMAQLVLYDNPGFFIAAHRLARKAPELFGPVESLRLGDWEGLEALFRTFHEQTEELRRAGSDVTVDISPESTESLRDQARRLSDALDSDVAGLMIGAVASCRAAVRAEAAGFSLDELRARHASAWRDR